MRFRVVQEIESSVTCKGHVLATGRGWRTVNCVVDWMYKRCHEIELCDVSGLIPGYTGTALAWDAEIAHNLATAYRPEGL